VRQCHGVCGSLAGGGDAGVTAWSVCGGVVGVRQPADAERRHLGPRPPS